MDFSGDAEIEVHNNSEETIIIKPLAKTNVRIRIGSNCKVSTYMIQEEKTDAVQVNHVGEGSVLLSHCLWLKGGKGRVESILEGNRSEAHGLHIFVEKETFRLNTVLRHMGKDTKGGILVKGVVKDMGSATLDGMIKIDKSGSGADSILKEHVMLLNPGAHAVANPDLEIENNNVSSTHAATVSQIDDNKLFYLESRGIEIRDAKVLIVSGFLESGINNIKDGEMRTEFLQKTSESLGYSDKHEKTQDKKQDS
ncbi:SufD family Fe-S cluster assembly protein [Candidatus Micrarchaeota archaeon]|nr:SufD family Fe-S cluster assembly protein [Candidatus Micrarchaeota archaeon]